MVLFYGFYFFIKLLLLFMHCFPDFIYVSICVLLHLIELFQDDYFEFFVRQFIDLHIFEVDNWSLLDSFVGVTFV